MLQVGHEIGGGVYFEGENIILKDMPVGVSRKAWMSVGQLLPSS